MLGHRRQYWVKYILTLSIIAALFVVLLPKPYAPNSPANTFSLFQMRYSGLDINRFTDRLTLKANVCQTVAADKFPMEYPRTLLYSKGLNMVYCPVTLSFSTWMKHTMLQMESKPLALRQLYNVSTLQAIHFEARALNLQHPILLHPEALVSGPWDTLLIVRDPWQRLIAAYNELGRTQRGYKTQCSAYINTFYRELRFEGFLQCLIHYANGTHSLRKLNSELSPISTMCSVCRVPYTVIVKYESLEPDIYDFITHIQSGVNTKFMQLYQSATMPVSFPAEVVNSFLNSVNRNVIAGIQRVYALDFTLFDYTLR